MGPAHHHRVRLGPGAGDDRGQEPVGIDQQPFAGRPELERQRGVDHVAAGQAHMEEAALGPDGFGDLADERDHVVVGRPLDLGDPIDIDAGARLERGQRAGDGMSAAGCLRLARPPARRGAWPRSGPGRTRSRPSPGACSGGSRAAPSHRAEPTGNDARAGRCRGGAAGPGASIWSAAAASRPCAAASRSAPRPTTRQHPPASGPDGSVVVPRGSGVEEQRAGRRRLAQPRRSGRRIAAGPDIRRRPARSATVAPGSVGSREPVIRAVARPPPSRPLGGREQPGSERHRQPRQDRLGLGIAEPGIAFEQDRSVDGQDQPGVQRADGTASRVGQAPRGSAGGRRRAGRSASSSARSGSGLKAPIPPVFGPSSPSRRRLWSRARGRATASRPSHQGDQARFGTGQALLDHDRLGTRARLPVGPGANSLGERKSSSIARSASASESHTVTPLPAARPSALTTTAAAHGCQFSGEARRAASGRGTRSARAIADPGRRRDLVAERLARFDPGRRRRGAEDARSRPRAGRR